MKRSPLASSRNPDSPPKPRNPEVRISPLRYSSEPNRRCERSRVSNEGIGRALTSIETGAATENSSAVACFGGGWVASCARANCGIAIVESPAAVDCRKRRRLRRVRMNLRMQFAPAARPGGGRPPGLAEQLGELFGDGAAEFLGIDDGDRAAIVAGDVVADADRDQLDRRAGLDFLDD